MRAAGLPGVRQGAPQRTTIPGSLAAGERAQDLLRRRFAADGPDRLGVCDSTYLRTWEGFAYLALVIDVYSRRIVGWALTSQLRTDLPLEALEHARWDRRDRHGRNLAGLIHHSASGSQDTAICYTDRLADAGTVPSVGSGGDSYDNALAASTIGQIKAELIHRRGPWRTLEQLECALFEYFDWWNHHRLRGEIGMITPAEKEALATLTTDPTQGPDPATSTQ